jgi:hypothetical protein
MKSETPHTKPRREYSLGERANGDNPERVKLFLFLQKKAEEKIKAIVTMDFLKTWGIPMRAQELPDFQREIATIVVRSKVRFKDWSESSWLSFCREYVEYCSEESEGNESLVFDDELIHEVDSVDRADFLEIILREKKSEITDKESNGHKESDSDVIEAIDMYLHALQDRKMLLLRQKHAADPEGEGFAFYQELQKTVAEKRGKIEQAKEFRDFRAVVDSEEKVQKGDRSYTKRTILSPEKFQEYMNTASDDVQVWMQQEIDAAGRALGKWYSENFRAMKERREGVNGFFDSRSEEFLRDIENADYDTLVNIGQPRWKDGKSDGRWFIPQKDIRELGNRFPDDKKKIQSLRRKTEGAIYTAWQKRMDAAKKEKAESRLHDIENTVSIKLAWAEAEYTNPANAGKITPEQYENLQKFLNKSVSDAKSAFSEGRFPRLQHILKEVSDAEFKPLVPMGSEGRKSVPKKSVHKKGIVIRSRNEPKTSDNKADKAKGGNDVAKSGEQLLRSFESIPDGAYLDIIQRNGIDRIGRKVNGKLLLGVTDDFGDMHYFPLDTFEEKIRSGWITSIVERGDNGVHSKDTESQDPAERAFHTLKEFFKHHQGSFQKDGNTLTIDEISDEKIKIRFQLKGEASPRRASIGLKQVLKWRETAKEHFGILMDTPTSTPVGNPGNQPPLPDVTPPNPENLPKSLMRSYDELMGKLGERKKDADLELTRLGSAVAAGLQEIRKLIPDDDESDSYIREERIQLVADFSSQIIIRLEKFPWTPEEKKFFAETFVEKSIDDFLK